jgi:hypothetical protein
MKSRIDMVRLIRAHHRRLLREHRATGDTGLIAVGIGWASKNGQRDFRRGLSLIYLVKSKKQNVPDGQRIRSQVPLSIPADKRRASKTKRKPPKIVMNTDIMEMPQPAKMSGAQLNAPGEQFTGGAVVTWGGAANPSYGIISVGHAVANVTQSGVTIAAPNQVSFTGTVYAQTDTNDEIDACLIQIAPADAHNHLGITLPPPSDPDRATRSITDLTNDAQNTHPLGYTLNIGDSKILTYSAYFPQATPQNPLIEGCPNRTDLLLTTGDSCEFVPGTSGSVWLGGGDVADAIQIAGFPPNYERGVGQPMVNYLAWANRQVGGGLHLIDVF